MRMNDRRFGPDAGPGLTGGVNVGVRPPPVTGPSGVGLTGGVNVGVRPPPVTGPGGVGLSRPMSGMPTPRSMTPMAADQIMPTGRAYAKGGMVGCDWKPKSSATMRGAARKGK